MEVNANTSHTRLALHLPRCLALLGGTTRWSDCVEALHYLLRPAQLVRGAKIAEYEQALRLSPNLPESHYNLGLVLTQGGDVKKAIVHHEQALEDPFA